jgi:hypothetical protein
MAALQPLSNFLTTAVIVLVGVASPLPVVVERLAACITAAQVTP